MRVTKIVLAAGLMLCLAATAFAQNKFEKEVELDKAAVKLAREVQSGNYDVIRADELKALMDSGHPVTIVDTMPKEASYDKAHIPGAVQFLFPIPDMNAWDAGETAGQSPEQYEALLGPDKFKTIVVYCGFVKCTRSHNGAVWAKRLGYKNVFRFPGGIYAWMGADYPTEQGD